MRKELTAQDAVVLEMTTNAFQLYDDLTPYALSVTLVHPPHVALITRAQVMTDQIAALTLARLHAAGLLPAVWVPPAEVRDLRALLAQRAKTVRLATQAKNRLHAALHRYHLPPVEGDLFSPAHRDWWLALPVSALERVRIANDLDTLAFARTQIAALERALADLAAQDPRVPLLVQLPGIRFVTALTLLAAIGDIARFPTSTQLVGYAGLGARVHASGLTHRSGRITKAGRRDVRSVMVEAAWAAANSHPHWQAQLQRLEPRLGRNKAIVAIARKLLVAVWHVLTHACADRFAQPQSVARRMATYAYTLGRANRAAGQTVGTFVRAQLDRLDMGADLDAIPWGQRTIPMPPSCLAAHD
jgi:transposase